MSEASSWKLRPASRLAISSPHAWPACSLRLLPHAAIASDRTISAVARVRMHPLLGSRRGLIRDRLYQIRGNAPSVQRHARIHFARPRVDTAGDVENLAETQRTE